MKHIPLVVDARMLNASGIGTYLQNILPNLLDFEPLLLLQEQDQDKFPWLKGFRKKVLESPIYSIQEHKELYKQVPKCNIYWAPHYNMPVYLPQVRRKLATVHDINHIVIRQDSLAKRLYARLMMYRTVKQSDRIITVSEFSKSEISQHFPSARGKVRVILNGYDQFSFHPTWNAEIQKALRRKRKLPSEFLLYVGNVKPHKNLVNLLKALKSLKDQGIEYPLVIVGKTEGFITGLPLKEKIEQLSLNKQVTNTGAVSFEELTEIYRMAKVFVFPSLYEGFGFPPLEAMASGTPVACSHAGSLPEVCQDAVVYFDPHTVEDMAEKIRLVWEQDQKYRKKGLEHTDAFNWEVPIKQHKQLLQEMLDSISS